MYIIFLALTITYFIFFVLIVFRRINRFNGVPITEKMKCGTYCHLICGLWGGVLVVAVMLLIAGLSFEDIGIRHIRFDYGPWFTGISLFLGGMLLLFSLYQMIVLAISKKHKVAAEEKYGNHHVLSGILPRSKKEKRLWSLLSLSAGVCEEIIFRGFLVLLFQAIFPDISIFLLILIPNILFGIAHLYQRLAGVIGSALLGVLFMCLFLVTDSLIIPILLHFIYDFSIKFTLSENTID